MNAEQADISEEPPAGTPSHWAPSTPTTPQWDTTTPTPQWEPTTPAPQWASTTPQWVTSFAPPAGAGETPSGPWTPAPVPYAPYGAPGVAGAPGVPQSGSWSPGPGPSAPPYGGYEYRGFQPPPPVPPAGGTWQQPPSSPGKRGRSGLAIILVASILSALIGLAIGSRMHRPPQTLTSAFAPAAPSTGSQTPTPTDPSSGAGGGIPSNPAGPTNPTNPTNPGAGSSGSISAAQAASVAAKVDVGVVDINTRLGYQNGAGAGTGMILSSTGEILTNNHVVDGATSISVTVVTTGRKYNANVVGTDPTEDIAVIQLQGASGLKTIPLGDSSAVAVGDPVVAIGNAGGLGGTPAVVTGTVQALNQTVTASDQGGANAETLNGVIQIDAPLQPGDSGGPLANQGGQVIGIDTAASRGSRFNSGGPVGFAIPIAHALSFADEIQGGHASATVHLGLPGFLGVSISATASGPSGAVITGVQPSTPAAGAGLAQGDVITSINGQTVDSAKALTTLTRSHKPGDKVTVGWTDANGASHTAGVTLATGPAD